MTLDIWQFVYLLMGTFALGIVVGIISTLIGITISAAKYRKDDERKM